MLKKTILPIIFWGGCSLLLTAQNIPYKYVAHRTTDIIDIDGNADEKPWKHATWSSDFIDIEGTKKPTYRTRMKMLWDEDYLYFYAQMEEPQIWGTLKQRDTVIFYNNDFEIFIDPDGDTHNYLEFEMNALNTVWDLFLTKPYRNNGKVLDSWDIQGLKSAVHIDGTVNDSTDEDQGWSVEIAIPWSVLTEASHSNQPPNNEFWRINFSRVNWDFDLNEGRYSRKKDEHGKFLPEYNWVWSPQGVINMHEPEHWGYVYFSDKEVGDSANFDLPKEEHIKALLYENYRKLLGAGEHFETIKNEIVAAEHEVMGESIILNIEQHVSGWNIWTVSPFSNATLLIKADGKYKRYEKHD